MHESIRKIRSLLGKVKRKLALKPEAQPGVEQTAKPPAEKIKFMPDWAALIRAEQDLWNSIQNNGGGKKILIATAVGGHRRPGSQSAVRACAREWNGQTVSLARWWPELHPSL